MVGPEDLDLKGDLLTVHPAVRVVELEHVCTHHRHHSNHFTFSFFNIRLNLFYIFDIFRTIPD